MTITIDSGALDSKVRFEFKTGECGLESAAVLMKPGRHHFTATHFVKIRVEQGDVSDLRNGEWFSPPPGRCRRNELPEFRPGESFFLVCNEPVKMLWRYADESFDEK